MPGLLMIALLGLIYELPWTSIFGALGTVSFWLYLPTIIHQYRKNWKGEIQAASTVALTLQITRWTSWIVFAFASTPFDIFTFGSRAPGIALIALVLSQTFVARPSKKRVVTILLTTVLLIALLCLTLIIFRESVISQQSTISKFVAFLVLPFGITDSALYFHKYRKVGTKDVSVPFVLVRLSAFANMTLYFAFGGQGWPCLTYAVLTLGHAIVASQLIWCKEPLEQRRLQRT